MSYLALKELMEDRKYSCNLDYIKPDEATCKTIEKVREHFKSLEGVLRDLPESRERSLALTKLEECLMWTTKGIVVDFKYNTLEEVSND